MSYTDHTTDVMQDCLSSYVALAIRLRDEKEDNEVLWSVLREQGVSKGGLGIPCRAKTGQSLKKEKKRLKRVYVRFRFNRKMLQCMMDYIEAKRLYKRLRRENASLRKALLREKRVEV